MRLITALAALIALGATAADAPNYPIPGAGECHFVNGAALGCVDGSGQYAAINAVTMFENYGLKASDLGQEYVQSYAHQHGCGGIRDSRYISGLTIQVLGRYRASTPDALIPVDRVSISAPNQGRIYWIDERYLAGKCPVLSPDKGGDPVNAASRG